MSISYPARSVPGAPAHMVAVRVGTPAFSVLSLAEAKLVAGLNWETGNPLDALMQRFIASATRKVETDTGIILPQQPVDVFFDAVPRDHAPFTVPVRPVTALTSFTAIDAAGVAQALNVATWLLDGGSAAPTLARVALAATGAWPTDLRSFQPYVLRLVAGWPTVEALTAAEPMLVHLVGRLTAHYATLGRDLASTDALSAVPFGYEEDIAPYRPVTVA